MPAIHTNRGDINLPAEVSNEIMQKVQLESAIMRKATRIELPGRGAAINVITGDPSAAWVGETEKKPVSDPNIGTKIMQAYKLAVIVPFSNEFRRDVVSLYGALLSRLPRALGRKFDESVIVATAPDSNFDVLSGCTQQDISSDAYGGLVAADGDIATNGGIMNGIILSPQGKSVFLAAVDGDQRPLFNNVTSNGIPQMLGSEVLLSQGAYAAGTSPSPNLVGVVGDFTQALWGSVEGVQISISDQATLDDGNGGTINLFQQNMFAVRAEIELGFRADTDCFNVLTTPA
jgi:HK97 family phage major capsid protein